MADEKNPNEATETADLYYRHGDPDPSQWDEAEAVTGRPADKPTGNSTFADRAKSGKAEAKVVEKAAAENKAVQSAEAKKAPARRTRKK